MSQDEIHELIFEQWSADLSKKDRSKKGVRFNFEELFSTLNKAQVPFKIAKSLLPLAIKIHLPNLAVRRNTWQKWKTLVSCSEEDFNKSWIDGIKNTATAVFFEEYPIVVNDDDDGEPKKYGGMSEKEYKLQRRHADSFPTLNTDRLEREFANRHLNLDVEDVLGDMYDDK